MVKLSQDTWQQLEQTSLQPSFGASQHSDDGVQIQGVVFVTLVYEPAKSTYLHQVEPYCWELSCGSVTSLPMAHVHPVISLFL